MIRSDLKSSTTCLPSIPSNISILCLSSDSNSERSMFDSLYCHKSSLPCCESSFVPKSCRSHGLNSMEIRPFKSSNGTKCFSNKLLCCRCLQQHGAEIPLSTSNCMTATLLQRWQYMQQSLAYKHQYDISNVQVDKTTSPDKWIFRGNDCQSRFVEMLILV